MNSSGQLSGTSEADGSVSNGIDSSSGQSGNYCNNYFDVNDILANSRRLVSTATVAIKGLGPELDPSGDSQDIEIGTKMEVPLWLARELHSEGLIDVSLPKGFNRTFREIFEADANCVDLHKLGPNYYKFGQHLADMNLDESEDIANSLVETFHQRYHRLVNYSLSSTNDKMNDMQTFIQQLDNEEKKLFASGKHSLDQIKDWENRSIEKVVANDVVLHLRKKKRLITEDIQISGQTPNSSQS